MYVLVYKNPSNLQGWDKTLNHWMKAKCKFGFLSNDLLLKKNKISIKVKEIFE